MPHAKHIALFIAIAIAFLVFVALGLYKLMNARTFQMFGGLTSHVQTQHKLVALTFDDGPTINTKEVLNALAQEKVTATFMLIGQEIERHPEQAKEIVAQGHQIGNHSYSHEHMIFRPISFYQQEVEKTDSLIRSIGYTGEIVFRPPYGKKLFGLPYYLSQHQRKTIMWDVEPESFPDVAASTANIVTYTAEHTKPGSIILLHGMYDNGHNSRAAITPVIHELKAKGYKFVSVSELLKAQE